MVAGDEMGDELLARFRPFRGRRGDRATGCLASGSLRQRIRSLGEWCSASLSFLRASEPLSTSFQSWRPAGVTALFASAGAGGDGCLEVESLGVASAGLLTLSRSMTGAWKWKACSLLLVVLETGSGGSGWGAVVLETGLLLDLCHCCRCPCQCPPITEDSDKNRSSC